MINVDAIKKVFYSKEDRYEKFFVFLRGFLFKCFCSYIDLISARLAE